MNFDLSDEQRMIRDTAREFTREQITPQVARLEQEKRYPYEIMAQMAELGLMGIPIPEQWGGAGGDWVGMHLCIEEISRGDPSLGAMLDITVSVVAQELLVFGNEEQRKRYLSPLARGEAVGAFALTEADSGSDAAAMRTTAVRQGGEYILNGNKQFITNIGLEHASLALVAAKTTLEDGSSTISTFIVPKDSPGLTIGPAYAKMAWATSATHEMIMEDCRIPAGNLLGDPRRGLAQHLAVLETGRISIAAVAVGAAAACLELALTYATQRRQFGRPLIDFQAVEFKLADMAMHIELARNQYLKAACLKDQGRPHTLEATVAKLFASEMAERAASDAVQIHGGYGYMNEYAVSRFYKGVKILQIVEGTSEVQRMLLGRLLRAGRLP
ncbi:MAG: acyl-CoA dehydrogenase family protein [Deltaproteobacteria bacterium]|nr:acyl-CoA dehydrogenase family protein [Deltaproteobacteria bacterium]